MKAQVFQINFERERQNWRNMVIEIIRGNKSIRVESHDECEEKLMIFQCPLNLPLEFLADILVVPPVLGLALPGAVGHDVTVPTAGELLGLAVRARAVTSTATVYFEIQIGQLVDAVGTELRRSEFLYDFKPSCHVFLTDLL